MTEVGLYDALERVAAQEPVLRQHVCVRDMFRLVVTIKTMPNFYVPLWMWLIPPLAVFTYISGRSWTRFEPDIYVIRWGRFRFLPFSKMVVEYREVGSVLHWLWVQGYCEFVDHKQDAEVRKAIYNMQKQHFNTVSAEVVRQRAIASL